MYLFIYCTVANVSFNQSIYSVNESDGSIEPVLQLSRRIFTDVTVMIKVTDNTATGKGWHHYITNYSLKCIN